MRILEILDNPFAWKSGIWYHRTEVPLRALKMRGHSAKEVAIGETIPDKYMEYPNTVKMGRIYPQWSKPIEVMKAYKKLGKKVVYDLDDDFWYVDPSNPSKKVSNAFKDQYEGLMKEADVITTPSPILAKKIRKLIGKKKPIHICHNGIDFEDYRERPHNHEGLIIGYMGASSHWRDLQMIVPALERLYKEHDFTFVIYGMIGEPMESAMYHYSMILQSNLQPEQNPYYEDALGFYDKIKNLNMTHIPFYTPALHPSVLSRADFDIGLAPLEDNEFNRGKSCIKFYEYAAMGTATIASNVEPYKSECDYRAKNTTEDWYQKIKKLIVDEQFRLDLAKKQQKWVKENRSIDKIGLEWELACQKDSGLKILSQEGANNKFNG